MLFNVVTLLQEHLGSSRDLELVAEPVSLPADGYQRVVDGTIRLMRTERGVLVNARLGLVVPLQCARCLEPFSEQITMEFDEEYVLSAPHPVTGRRVEHDEADFLIDDHWHLDLSEAVRQYEQSAVPLIALCRADCPGFAAVTPAAPPTSDAADRRWSALSGLAARLHEEESDGAPEA
ncbi:MAG: DUF177 domain-containing protein [Chloroflexi bacterium]|nr:DUF177 domain-containing protein [Chloroflexota bacterium]